MVHTLSEGERHSPDGQTLRWQHFPDRGGQAEHEGVKILLADDNAADVELFKAAFEALHDHHEIEIARDGEEALHCLKDDQSAGKLPAIVLLDISMPKLDGFEVLSAIRADPELKTIPVIMLSGSCESQDIQHAHELGANSYLCKSPYDFFDLVDDFERYWLHRARLPGVGD